MFRFLAYVTFLFSVAFAGETLRVATAANLSFMANALKTAFEAKNPQADLIFIFGPSGALATQISNGLEVDLFLSADTQFPEKVAAWGLAAHSPRVYAMGRLVLLNTGAYDLSPGLAILKSPLVKQFAMANPEVAPYGRAAQEALTRQNLWDEVKTKAVMGQTITQTLQMVNGGTGIGFVHHGAVYRRGGLSALSPGKDYIWVDPKLYAPLEQAFVVLKTSAAKPTVMALAAFLLSPAGQTLFEKYGYLLPKP